MRRRRDERGAVAVFVAVLMVVLLGVGALVVDIGTQRVARADMQALADVVAMDLSRQLDGRAAAVVETGLDAAKEQSVARNSDTIGDDVEVSAELGTIDDAGVFSAVSGTTVPDAVRVSTTASVPFHFVTGSGGANRSAVAVARAQGCYKLGSWGARLGSSSANAALLATVLAGYGINASVGASTYQGLVGATVDAGALATQLGLASPEALGTTTVSLSTLLTAAAQVIGTSGASAGQVAALDAVRSNLATLGNKPVALGSLFSIASGAGSGLSTAVDLADLVVGSISVANGSSAATVDLGTGLPGVGSFPSTVGLIQNALAACGFAGSTPNESNQVAVTSSASLTSGSLSLGLPFIAGVTIGSATPMTLTVTTARATSTLDAITCGSASRSATVSTTGGLLGATFVLPVQIKGTVLGISHTLDLTYRATLSQTGSPGSVTITVPSQAYDTPYSNGGSQAQLPAATLDPVGTVSWLSTSQLTDLLNAVMSTVVTPLVSALNSNVVGPLSDLAGLRTAGADVLLLEHPTCSTPALRG